MADGTFEVFPPDWKKMPSAERSVIPLLDSNTRTRTVNSLTESLLSLDSSQRRLNGDVCATSITSFFKCGSVVAQIMAFVFMCLQEKPAAIFESGNMPETRSER